MKTIALTLFASALVFAQSQSGQAPDASARNPPAQASKQVRPKGVPDAAVEVQPYLFRYTDSAGKTWMYRDTPFGLRKWQDTSATSAATQPAHADRIPVTITDLGDSYRFERVTPFGSRTWTHKKTELTDDDKALVNQWSPAAPPAPSTKSDLAQTTSGAK